MLECLDRIANTPHVIAQPLPIPAEQKGIEETQSEVRDPVIAPTAVNPALHKHVWFDWASEVDSAYGLSSINGNATSVLANPIHEPTTNSITGDTAHSTSESRCPALPANSSANGHSKGSSKLPSPLPAITPPSNDVAPHTHTHVPLQQAHPLTPHLLPTRQMHLPSSTQTLLTQQPTPFVLHLATPTSHPFVSCMRIPSPLRPQHLRCQSHMDHATSQAFAWARKIHGAVSDTGIIVHTCCVLTTETHAQAQAHLDISMHTHHILII